ncbi:stage III sporulation protein AF [Virgibacillus sp. W0430]|uniref:stage III sporulation protein AF n=1 Tax=Virgibacillus sp. W0430 TaxID=3391580 RepID=UPI003F48DD14
MHILIQWITQILIFILLATIIDLLIPKTTMKKYIKLVLGLILLLIFLKPLFLLFHFDLETAVEPTMTSLFDENDRSQSIENTIKLQKKEIQASQDAYILKQMETHLKSMANTPLLENYELEISDIQFTFQRSSELNYEDLRQIIVYLKQPEAKKGAVSAVDEIVINTETEKALLNDTIQDSTQITELLANIWQFDQNNILIEWEGGTL